MNKDLLLHYADLKIQASKIEEELEMIKEQALAEVLAIRGDTDSPVQLSDLPGYSFTVKPYRTWQYTGQTQDLEKTLKARQKEEQQLGLAEVVNEKLSLVFNSPKSKSRLYERP